MFKTFNKLFQSYSNVESTENGALSKATTTEQNNHRIKHKTRSCNYLLFSLIIRKNIIQFHY